MHQPPFAKREQNGMNGVERKRTRMKICLIYSPILLRFFHCSPSSQIHINIIHISPDVGFSKNKIPQRINDTEGRNIFPSYNEKKKNPSGQSRTQRRTDFYDNKKQKQKT